MTYEDIKNYEPVNDVDNDKVLLIAESIKNNGYVGCPILVCEGYGMLITGSHRLAALNYLENNDDDFEYDIECAEDVSEILEAYCEENDITIDQIAFDSLSSIFEGTWVEEYKNEIAEW